MATLEDVERRLQEVETRLRRQRCLTTGLAALAVVGLLTALRPPEPEILRARRLEIVDSEDRVGGGFGLGVGYGAHAGGESGSRGWYLLDPSSGASAAAMIGEAEAQGQESETQIEGDLPFAMTSLEGGFGCAQIVASNDFVTAELLCDSGRGVTLNAQHDRAGICIEAPPFDPADHSGVDVLRLEHTSGKPTIQGWDDKGLPTIDLR